jgi:hypothetical protein
MKIENVSTIEEDFRQLTSGELHRYIVRVALN